MLNSRLTVFVREVIKYFFALCMLPTVNLA